VGVALFWSTRGRVSEQCRGYGTFCGKGGKRKFFTKVKGSDYFMGKRDHQTTWGITLVCHSGARLLGNVHPWVVPSGGGGGLLERGKQTVARGRGRENSRGGAIILAPFGGPGMAPVERGDEREQNLKWRAKARNY